MHGPAIHQRLNGGDHVVVNCDYGYGRSGTICALLLMETGFDADTAIRTVRQARPGAVESAEQVAWLLGKSGIRP